MDWTALFLWLSIYLFLGAACFYFLVSINIIDYSLKACLTTIAAWPLMFSFVLGLTIFYLAVYYRINNVRNFMDSIDGIRVTKRSE
jgi:uncharacterized membrane protein